MRKTKVSNRNCLLALAALLIAALAPLSSGAQVNIDKPIIMDGGTEADRQVDSLGAPSSPSSALRASSAQQGTLNYIPVSGTDTLTGTTNLPLSAYEPGLILNLQASAANTKGVILNINGLGNIPVKKHVNEDLAPNDLLPGKMLSVVYDGTNFQLISNNEKSCPTGFVEAGKHFCIETNERAATSFFNAVVDCYNINARLCSWGEWYYACQKTGLGLTALTNNFEWIDSASNEDGQVRVAGYAACTAAGSPPAVNSYSFRCCFSK